MSVAQVERVRSGVFVTAQGARSEGSDVRVVQRLAAGDLVRVDENGRAVLSLDGGGRYVLDHGASVRVRGPRAATLEHGRLWVSGGGEGGRSEVTQITVGDTVLHLRGARASIAETQGHATVSVLAGEVAYESGARRGAIRTGETGEISVQNARVAAHSAYDDWTGGLADDVPSNGGEVAGLGSVGARTPGETGQPRWPMVMQRLETFVTVRGDLAITTIDQWFFNPSSETVEGLYTFNTPPGAVLQMFGVDRRGQIVEGIVKEKQQAAAQYQAQVYRGSTHDPALLEWDAPGRYHARLYPIAGGSTRRVRVRYAQWLNSDANGRRVYRLPLAALDTRIGEFKADFDLGDANVTSVRAGHTARVNEDNHLVITESDVLPRSDLVVEMQGLSTMAATAQRVPQSGDPRGGYLRVAVRPPVETSREARDEGVDLVIVVDHSAATDDLALRLEQAFVESLLGTLDQRDSVLVLAGDVTTRAVGSERAELAPVTAERRRAITEALARDRLGGATDLGAMIAAAHRALRPGRNGAIVYVGDGHATVGENALPSLRAMMSRLSPRPRFYAVAVGEEPRLELLDGIASPAGLSRRITRRGDVARTSLELLEHVSRPLVRNVRVDLGPGVSAVYPAEPVDLPVGQPIEVVGRYPGDAPRTVTIRGLWNGREFTETLPISAGQIDDGEDLRYRWATMRLENLLARGEQRAVVVELGTRFGLITPFTSLYVPSEDEVSALEERRRMGPRIPTRFADLGVSDLFPLVGCSKMRSAVSTRTEESRAAQSAPDEANEEGGEGRRQEGPEGRLGGREAPSRSARYAIRNNGEPPHMARQASRDSVQSRGIFAALGAPGSSPSGEPQSPFGGIVDTQSTIAEQAAAAAPTTAAAPTPEAAPQAAQQRRATSNDNERDNRNGNMDGDRVGDAFGFGGLGANGTAWGGGGTGEGTIGLGNFGTMGHGSGTGSGQGYGSGAGGGLRGRGNRGPTVRAAPPQVTGQLSPEAIRRVVLRNLGQVAHCHEQGLAQNPSLEGRVVIRFIIGGTGSVMGSAVQESNLSVPSTASCIANAFRRWQFPSPEGGGIVTVNYPINLQAEGAGPSYAAASPRSNELPRESAPARAARRIPRTNPGIAVEAVSRCSDAASVALSERVGLWRERIEGTDAASLVAQYRRARNACEASSWAERVALLRLLHDRAGTLEGRIALYHALTMDRAAQGWMRSMILRALARSGQLARAQELGLGRLDANTMVQALGAAATPAQRLSVLGELARRYPDDMDLATRYLDEALAQNARDVVRLQGARMRSSAQADGRVRTAVGEALFAIGDEAEARRCFSEIVEFAPDDPAARRRLGDIALSHGWADEAYRQFQMLAVAENEAPEVLLRQAMAARMAGRLDEAVRLAERVAQESSSGNGTLGDVASAWIGLELGIAASERGVARNVIDALRSRWRLSSAARGAGALRIVARWAHPDDGAELYLQMPGESPRRSDWVAGQVFFESTVFADAPQSIALEVRRGEGARQRGKIELVLLFNEGQASERIERRTLEFDGTVSRHVFDLAGTTLTARPQGTSLVADPTVAAGVAAQGVRAGGAR
ncbi:MAG: AgmX/PglI C-terminal domain-containing protein [Myxococcales bacterium]|nr:AgmX/PglI C-terminal domain-containing protein [Myxococcales bacterium]